MAYPYQPGYYPSIGYQRPEYASQQIIPQQPIPTQPAIQQPGFLCRAVTSREEATVAQIPLDGTPSFFVNVSNGEIYRKAMLPDGTAPLATYTRCEDIVSSPPQYATVEQLSELSLKLEELSKKINSKEGLEARRNDPFNL